MAATVGPTGLPGGTENVCLMRMDSFQQLKAVSNSIYNTAIELQKAECLPHAENLPQGE